MLCTLAQVDSHFPDNVFNSLLWQTFSQQHSLKKYCQRYISDLSGLQQMSRDSGASGGIFSIINHINNNNDADIRGGTYISTVHHLQPTAAYNTIALHYLFVFSVLPFLPSKYSLLQPHLFHSQQQRDMHKSRIITSN